MSFGRLERYIFGKGLITVLTAMAALLGVIWVVRAVQEVDVLLNQGQGIATYLKMTSLGVPTLAAAIAPMALLIGLSQTINRLNADSELVVMHASGASRMALLRPFLALSFLTMLLVYFLHLWAGPLSMATLRNYVTQVRADLVSVVVREGRFQDVGSGLTFHVAARTQGGGLNGIFILDGRSETESITYLAREGAVTKSDGNSFLVLQDGQIQRLDHKSNALSVINFNSYAVNLSSFSGGKASRYRSQLEVPTLELINPNPDDPLYKVRPGRYRAELHSRLTGGLYPILVGLVLLAFVGNPSSHRQGQTLLFLSASGLIISLRGVTIVAEGALRKNADAVFVVWGVPLITIGFAIFILATDRDALPESLQKSAEKIGNRMAAAFDRFKKKPLKPQGAA